MYKTFTENIDKKVYLNGLNRETVHFVQTYGRTYINEYTHTRTPLLTNYLVINIIIYLNNYFYIYLLRKNVQNVQNVLIGLISAYFFSKTFVQTVI